MKHLWKALFWIERFWVWFYPGGYLFYFSFTNICSPFWGRLFSIIPSETTDAVGTIWNKGDFLTIQNHFFALRVLENWHRCPGRWRSLSLEGFKSHLDKVLDNRLTGIQWIILSLWDFRVQRWTLNNLVIINTYLFLINKSQLSKTVYTIGYLRLLRLHK